MTDNKTPKSQQRRDFLKKSAAVSSLVVAPNIISSCATGRGSIPAPGSRLNLGIIGVGNRGTNLMQDFMKDDRVQLVSVCDVNQKSGGYWGDRVAGRHEAARIAMDFYEKRDGKNSYRGVNQYQFHDEMLETEDLDIVVVASPDHWHSIHVVDAVNAGKDVYGEKPLSLTIREGRIMADAVADSGRVFQTGSQQRSAKNFRHACELVRNGYIGELKTVKCGLPGGTPDISKQGDRVEPEPVPEGFNYKRWIGPARMVPYIPATSHVNWRWNFDYSGGQVTDWGGHHPDIAQWGMGTVDTGPVEIRNAKATYSDHPVFNTASEYSFDCVYDDGTILTISSEERGGVKFEGTEGWIWVNRGAIEAEPKSLLDVEIKENETHLTKSDNHRQNFVDCVFSREEPVAPIEHAHRSISLSHLGNIAMRLEQDLKWDPANEQFLGNSEANEYLHRPFREGWSLKGLPKGGRSLSLPPNVAPADLA